MPNDFDPSSIRPFHVIKCPFDFGDGQPAYKRMVAISHKNGHLFGLKATSNLQPYNSDARLAGVVVYRAGEITLFEKDTAIQPDNQFTISHSEISKHHRNGNLEILGALPTAFKAQLIKAANESLTIEPRQRKRLLEALV